MTHIIFYFDFLSPYAYLAFERLPLVLQGSSYSVSYQPVFLPAIFKHYGQVPPAQIEPKRQWIARHVLWLAREHGIALQLPKTHPFDPLPLLRLAVACDPQGLPNRYVVETIFRHVWQGRGDALEPQRLQALQAQLAPKRATDSEEVKDQLKAYTDQAIAHGAFGVPSFVVDGQLFWGLDALAMVRERLV